MDRLSVFLVFCCLSSLAAPADVRERKELRIEGNPNTLAYRFFQPESVLPLSSLNPLVVMLHGCLEDSESFAMATEMNEVAQTRRFSVVYPEQSKAESRTRCWNWFERKNQQRGMGEPEAIVQLVHQVLKDHPNLDPKRVFVAGLSAGGALSHTLGVCYPDIFKAVAVHSGVGYRFADTLTQSVSAMAFGTQRALKETIEEAANCVPHRKRITPTLIIHGTQDKVTRVINADQISEQVLGMAKLTEKGSLMNRQTEAASEKAFAFVREDFGGQKEGLLVRKILLEGLGHAWAGGREKWEFSDPKGPRSSEMIWRFFREISQAP